MTDEGVDNLARILPTFKFLRSIRLEGNHLTRLPSFLAECSPASLQECIIDDQHMSDLDQMFYRMNSIRLLIIYARIIATHKLSIRNFDVSEGHYHRITKTIPPLLIERLTEIDIRGNPSFPIISPLLFYTNRDTLTSYLFDPPPCPPPPLSFAD